MKTVWFDGFSSSNKQRKKNRLKCKRGLLNDGTKDWEKNYILSLYGFWYSFDARWQEKLTKTDHKMKL